MKNKIQKININFVNLLETLKKKVSKTKCKFIFLLS